jgi:hypothetical protein
MQSRDDYSREIFLIAARAAAIAQMTEEAERLRTLAEQQPRHPFFWVEAKMEVEAAHLEAYLGDPEAGWARLEPWADDPFVFATRAYLKASPLHQHLFGEVAGFQRFVGSE